MTLDTSQNEHPGMTVLPSLWHRNTSRTNPNSRSQSFPWGSDSKTDEHERPLHNLEAEQSTLGAMLLEESAARLGRQLLQASDFYRELHKTIFATLCALVDEGRAFDFLVVSHRLREERQLEKCGGTGYLVSLIDACPSSANVEAYARVVKETAFRREVIANTQQLDRVARTLPSNQVVGALRCIADRALLSSADSSRKHLVPIGELRGRPAPLWLIQNILTEGTTSLLTADPASYKSFLMLHFAYCIAHGISCFDRCVRQGCVVYVAGEGAGGLRARSMAWDIHHDLEPCPDLLVWEGAVQVADADEVAQFLGELQLSGVVPSLIVFDTLNRCAEGLDENSARDMGLFCAGLKRIVDATGAHVCVVHHNNAGGKSRGSTALPGAFDTRMSAKRHGQVVTIECQKQKDGATEFSPFALAARVVDIGEKDEFGEARTSLVLEKAALPATATAKGELFNEDRNQTPSQNHVTATRRAALLQEHAQISFKEAGGVRHGLLLDQCLKAGIYGVVNADDRDCANYKSAKTRFSRDLDALQGTGALRKVRLGDGKDVYVRSS